MRSRVRRTSKAPITWMGKPRRIHRWGVRFVALQSTELVGYTERVVTISESFIFFPYTQFCFIARKASNSSLVQSLIELHYCLNHSWAMYIVARYVFLLHLCCHHSSLSHTYTECYALHYISSINNYAKILVFHILICLSGTMIHNRKKKDKSFYVNQAEPKSMTWYNNLHAVLLFDRENQIHNL